MQWLKFIIFLVLNLLNINDIIKADNAEIIVEIPNGKLRGKDNEYFYSFESIPYAEPPIGELRLESPKPYTQIWENEFDATNPPVICMQWNQFTEGEDKLTGVEDCLTINIYKPKKKANNETADDGDVDAKYQVLVHIHGGAFMFGSTLIDDVSLFMRSGQFIVVKFTYRLGPLGFLSAEDEILPGNYGLKDQRLALQWIKENIASFGGDPLNILVIGFSAGAVSVHYHLLRHDFQEIAKVAASFSGTAFSPWALVKNPRARAFEMAKNLKCSKFENSTDIKNCFKSLAAEDIVRDVRSFLVFGYNPFTTFGPVIEPANVPDAFLIQSPEKIIQSGNYTQIPWLVSYLAQDGGYNAAELLQKSPRREELIEVFNERWYDLAPYNLFFKDSMSSVEELDDYSMNLKRNYLGEQEFSIETYPDVQRMYTDVLFKNGVQKAVELHKLNSKAPIYAYVYDNPSEENLAMLLSKRTDIKFGTVHGDDVALILPSLARKLKPRDDEILISNKLVKMLEDFILNDHELIYGDCKFVNNVDQEQLSIMVITQNSCENKNLIHFP